MTSNDPRQIINKSPAKESIIPPHAPAALRRSFRKTAAIKAVSAGAWGSNQGAVDDRRDTKAGKLQYIIEANADCAHEQQPRQTLQRRQKRRSPPDRRIKTGPTMKYRIDVTVTADHTDTSDLMNSGCRPQMSVVSPNSRYVFRIAFLSIIIAAPSYTGKILQYYFPFFDFRLAKNLTAVNSKKYKKREPHRGCGSRFSYENYERVIRESSFISNGLSH